MCGKARDPIFCGVGARSEEGWNFAGLMIVGSLCVRTGFTSGASLAAFEEVGKAEQFIPELTWQSGLLAGVIARVSDAMDR